MCTIMYSDFVNRVQPSEGVSLARQTIRLKPGFDDALARAGFSVRGFARFAKVPHQTLFALIHPEYQHKDRTRGGMQKKTAWKLAQAYAKAAGLEEEVAYQQIIIEENCMPKSEVEQRSL